MPVHDELGIRMKESYEKRARSYLTRRTPVIIRIDGKAFHTFTRGFNKPYDRLLMTTMQETTQYLCEHIQGCVFGYTQSDEISLLLVDYAKLNSDSWFDYQVQKVCSVAASMATMAFNKKFLDNMSEIDAFMTTDWRYNSMEEFYEDGWGEEYDALEKFELIDKVFYDKPAYEKIVKAYRKAENSGAMFDARCFNIPQEEVTNYFYWRQIDATRNSIQMAGQAQFSDKQLHGKNQNDIQDMLHEQKGINWNDYITDFKRGSCCIRVEKEVEGRDGQPVIRHSWAIDHYIPIFSGEGRDYIEKLVTVYPE